MSSVNVNSLRFQEIVCHKNNKRCLGCGIFVGERRKFPEVAVVTDFYLGHWFCTEDCSKDYYFGNRMKKRKTQKRCPACGKHRKKVKRQQPLRTYVISGNWVCSSACKEMVKGMQLLREL